MREIPIPSDARFAINELKRSHGSKWKQRVLSCWASCSLSDLSDEHVNALNRLQKSHGTMWLARQK